MWSVPDLGFKRFVGSTVEIEFGLARLSCISC